ncbi:TetR/AcrR family transcriptional repressor of mexJK operon [Nakamurella sp. UYEF19]|uniref:TetR/AcrR family transcriptional regulator n=1 Tax=Nakamurella sp. UYEF19 TaxID=1756392 RepID=UPI00339360DC
MSISPTSARRGRPRGSEAPELLSIARKMFIANGFRGTTMDAVAMDAHISKQSLYRQYPSKDALYSAVVRDWVERGYDAMRPHTTALTEADGAREGLLVLARVLQAGLLSPPVLQMRTLIAAEAQRFPDVASDYVTRSWTRNIHILAEALSALAARGLLRIEDPELAAEQLTWLVVAAPLNRLTLQTGTNSYGEAELEAVAKEGVATFLSRYGPEHTEPT